LASTAAFDLSAFSALASAFALAFAPLASAAAFALSALASAFTLVAVVLAASIANAQQARDPRIADLVRAGKIRGALFLPQYTADPATGEVQGAAGGIVMIALARALAARVGLELVNDERPFHATSVSTELHLRTSKE
jgi:hypothetical protein